MKDKIISRFNEVHHGTYDYSKVCYEKMHNKVCIICPKHGEFWQTPHSHLKGQGCPQCGLESRKKKRADTAETFIEKAKKLHGDKYDYSKVEYISTHTKVKLICPKHGEFDIQPNCHLNGRGCPKCKCDTLRENFSWNVDEFINKSKEIHDNKYDYSKVKYINSHSKVCIICPKHGEFMQTPSLHLNGSGCPKCGFESRMQKRKDTTDMFVEKARAVHGDRYDYRKVNYNGALKKISIGCIVHGDFWQVPSYHLNGCGCPQCAHEIIKSSSELEILSFIKENYEGIIIHGDRKILKDGRELDIYVPELHLAFEFDGLYWHNEKNQPNKNYHLNKTKECIEAGIQLIHIFEDEWVYKREIVKSRILNLLNKSYNKIYARKCILKTPTSKEIREFLNNNHIQGYCNSNFQYGLYYNDELVSLMTFGKMRKNLGSTNKNGNYELIRFCNKLNTNVVGGASKLFNSFVKELKPVTITSYADRRWSNGRLYDKLGFTLSHESKPSYYYVINDKRKNRFVYRKDILVKEGYDASKTEHQIMLDRGIYRIYDCGCLVYKYESKID